MPLCVDTNSLTLINNIPFMYKTNTESQKTTPCFMIHYLVPMLLIGQLRSPDEPFDLALFRSSEADETWLEMQCKLLSGYTECENGHTLTLTIDWNCLV